MISMKKCSSENRSNYSDNHHQYEQIDVIALETMVEEDLASLSSHLEGIIRVKTRKNEDDVRWVEEDFCYVQREIQIRRLRTKAHAEWVLKSPWTNTVINSDDGAMITQIN